MIGRIFCLLAVLTVVPYAFAQTSQGTLTGSVTDSSGAIVAGVSVSAVHQETGFAYAAVTNSEGLYRVPYMNIGAYTVTFEAAGFKKLVRTGIQLRATETLQVNAALEIGNVVESV